MTAPTWSTTPANAETDKALRVAAAHVCGLDLVCGQWCCIRADYDGFGNPVPPEVAP